MKKQLIKAMNMIHGKSNTGEGGRRFTERILGDRALTFIPNGLMELI